MNAVIVTCSTLTNHLNAAQKKMHTDYPIIELNNKDHDKPEKFWRIAFQKIEALTEDSDTVLLALGVCGGAAVGWPFPRRVVMPKVDDCITLLMHHDDSVQYNLKKTGHFYLTENRDLMSIVNMRDNLLYKYGEKRARRVMKIWFDSYKSVDIVDTGVYNSYSDEYLTRARDEADAIGVPLCHVQGSNLILEKLVSGRWDEQFRIYEKGESMQETDFAC